MKKDRHADTDDEMLPEYDFTEGVRGKYVDQYRKGTNLARLDPDVASCFPTSEAVNEALRELIRIREERAAFGRPGPQK